MNEKRLPYLISPWAIFWLVFWSEIALPTFTQDLEMDDVRQCKRLEVVQCNLGYNFMALVQRPCAELM